MTRFISPPPLRRLAASVLALTLALAPMAQADTRATYAEAGRALFSFEVPDFWTLRSGGTHEITPPGGAGQTVPRVLSLTPTVEPTLWMGFLSPPGVTDLAAGRDYLRNVGSFVVQEPDLRDTQYRRIGGYPAEVFSGTGRRDGRAVQFSFALVDLPGARVAVIGTVIEAGTDPAFFETVNDVFASFRVGG